MKKNDFIEVLSNIGVCFLLVLMLCFVNFLYSSLTVHAGEIVSGDAFVSGDTVSGDTVSGDSVSGNSVSGNIVISGNTISGNFITSDQGDSIIFYLRLILFLMLFWFCWERIRNGIRSLNKMR